MMTTHVARHAAPIGNPHRRATARAQAPRPWAVAFSFALYVLTALVLISIDHVGDAAATDARVAPAAIQPR
jgi:hypothetical protein